MAKVASCVLFLSSLRFAGRKLLAFRDTRGATLVEFAIVGPLFLVLLIVTIDLLRISYSALTLQYVTARVAREVAVGPSKRPRQVDGNPLPGYETQGSWLITDMTGLANALNISLRPDHITICSFANLVSGDTCSPDDADHSGQIIAIRVLMPAESFLVGPMINLFTRRRYNITSLVVARNEPW